MTRQERIEAMEAILAKAEAEKRAFTEAEQKEWDEHDAALKKPQGELRQLGTALAAHKGERAYSLQRIMRAACGDRTVDAGFEIEVHQEFARGRKNAPEGFLVPLSAFVT